MVESRLVFTGAEYFARNFVSSISCAVLKYVLEQVAFAPDDAVDGLAWGASNCANRERLGRLFGSAVVACGNAFLDNLYLAIEPSGATFDQRYVSC
jgi:hypothetical protein